MPTVALSVCLLPHEPFDGTIVCPTDTSFSAHPSRAWQAICSQATVRRHVDRVERSGSRGPDRWMLPFLESNDRQRLKAQSEKDAKEIKNPSTRRYFSTETSD